MDVTCLSIAIRGAAVLVKTTWVSRIQRTALVGLVLSCFTMINVSAAFSGDQPYTGECDFVSGRWQSLPGEPGTSDTRYRELTFPSNNAEETLRTVGSAPISITEFESGESTWTMLGEMKFDGPSQIYRVYLPSAINAYVDAEMTFIGLPNGWRFMVLSNLFEKITRRGTYPPIIIDEGDFLETYDGVLAPSSVYFLAGCEG